VVNPYKSHKRVKWSDQCADTTLDVLDERGFDTTQMHTMHDAPHNLTQQQAHAAMHFACAKRCFDIAVALAALAVFGPVIGLCMLWVHACDGGPVLYRQWRVGRDGWLFRLYKLRTMQINAEAECGAREAALADPRVIQGCQWMRRSHIDELPQLWNILIGDMSIVGPRPERPEILERLREDIPHIEQRLAARPGLTGLAQVRNGYTNDVDGARRKLEYDLKYLHRPSVWGDVKVVLQTLPKFWDQAAC